MSDAFRIRWTLYNSTQHDENALPKYMIIVIRNFIQIAYEHCLKMNKYLGGKKAVIIWVA